MLGDKYGKEILPGCHVYDESCGEFGNVIGVADGDCAEVEIEYLDGIDHCLACEVEVVQATPMQKITIMLPDSAA